MRSQLFIKSLRASTVQIIKEAEELRSKNILELQWKTDASTWNILECLQHLNNYGNYYIPLIRLKMQQSNASPALDFNPGWLGNYFSKSMLPKKKMNKMKTFKSMDPINTNLTKEVIDVFIHQQNEMLSLLDEAQKKNISKIRIPISIARWLKIKLGDAFQFVINHNLRHFVQIKNIEHSFYSQANEFFSRATA